MSNVDCAELDAQEHRRLVDELDEKIRMLKAEFRKLKRRADIAEETVRIKKERLDEAEHEYEEEHQTFTIFSKHS